MIFPVNRPMVLAKAGVALRTITVTVAPTGPALAVDDLTQLLVVADAAALTGGSTLISAPLSALRTGMVFAAPETTSNGLAVQQIPGGVALNVDYG